MQHDDPVVYTSDTLELGWLRLALFYEWNGRCAWCGTPLADASFLTVDHIIPQSTFYNVADSIGVAPNFGMHDLENLAPVCAAGRSCNQTKGSRVYEPVVHEILAKAKKNAPGVRRRVMGMRKAGGLLNAILVILKAPMDEVRGALMEYGTPLAQRLYAIDSTLPDSYTSVHHIDTDLVEGESGCECMGRVDYRTMFVTLDSEGRAAYRITQLLGIDLDRIIEVIVAELVKSLESRVRDEGLDWGDHPELVDGGFGLCGPRFLSIDTLSVNGDSGTIGVAGSGRVRSEHAASVSWTDSYGERHDDSSSVYVYGPFRFDAWVALPFYDEVEINNIDDSDVVVEKL